MSAWDSPIMRISTGLLNTVNDETIGNQPGLDGRSKVAGMLGQTLWVSPDQIGLMHSTAIGVLYGGRYRYVRLRAADAVAVAVGQIAFWDTTVTDWTKAFQVTREEDLSSVDNAIFIAGIFISIPTPGRYCFIQDVGIVPVKFRGALTSAGAVGSRVFAAAAGDGADEGFADVLSSAVPTTFGDVSLMLPRYLGNAVTAPVATELDLVSLGFHNVLG